MPARHGATDVALHNNPKVRHKQRQRQTGGTNGQFGKWGCHRLGGAHAGGLVQWIAGKRCRVVSRHRGAEGRHGARQGRRRRSRRGDPRPGAGRRPGPEPGPPGLDQCRHCHHHAGLGHEPAVRFGPSRRGARHAADRRWRRQCRGGGRHGIDEQGAARGASARWREDGRLAADRHHDPRRIVGCLQRLSHGNDRRERRPPVADHPRHAGRLRRRLAEQGRSGPSRRQVQGRDRPRHHFHPQGRCGGLRRRIYQEGRHARSGRQAASPPSPRMAR